MKKILLILFLAYILFSCYEDKGNYDYREIPTIDSIVGTGGYKTVLYYDTLKLIPEIYSTQEDEFSYFWVLLDGMEFIDTLSFTKDIEWIISVKPGKTYNLVFSATSLKTGVETRSISELYVTSTTGTGYYVVKTIDDYTDIDYFKSDSILIIENMLSETYGIKLSGEARRASILKEYFYQSRVKGSFLFILSENNALVFDYDNGEILRELDDIFYFTSSDLDFQSIFFNQDFYILSNGKVYRINSGVTNIGKWSSDIYWSHSPNYYMSKYSAGFDNVVPLFFDEVSRTFAYSPKLSNSSALYTYTISENEINTTNMEYDLLYMGTRSISGTFHAYALMKHINNNSYKILDLTLGRTSDPVTNSYDVNSNSGLVKAEFRAVSMITPGMYFIENNKIKLYYFGNGTVSDFYEIPSDEKVVFFRQEYYGASNPALLIGTMKGDKYKIRIYEWKLDNDVYEDKGITYEFEGTGVPADVKPTNRGLQYYNN